MWEDAGSKDLDVEGVPLCFGIELARGEQCRFCEYAQDCAEKGVGE
jgi:hypothetical protein